MAYEINYEKKQLDIIKKSIPILIQQIKNGNPFRPTFQGNQLSYRFFRKQVYNLWNIVTDEDLSMEYEDETIWADMFVDFLMDIKNTNNIAKKEKQPTEQDNTISGIEKPEKDDDTANSGIKKPEQNSDTSSSGIEKPEKDDDTANSGIKKPEQISDTSSSGIEKPEKDSDISISDKQKQEQDIDTSNGGMQKNEDYNGNLNNIKAESAIGQHKGSMESNMEESNINEMKIFITFATTNGFLKISDIDSDLIGNSLTPRDVAEDAKTKIKKTKESKRKWTLRRIFGIICPCLRPKDK